MSKLITDFAPQQWSWQTTASPSCPSNGRIPSHPQYDRAGFPTKLYATMAACLLTQIFSFASLVHAYEEFDLIGGATPACQDCANNSAPSFNQTRVAMQDAYGQAPAVVGSDPVVEAPPAIGQTDPVTAEPMQHSQEAFQTVQQQPFDNQPFVNQQSFTEQQGFVDQPFVESQPFQSGGLGASEFEQGFNSGVEQVVYESEYPVQHFGQTYVNEIPVEQYSMDQTYPATQSYSSYQAMPTVRKSQNYNSTYTSSTSSSGNVQPGLAQQKAVRAAQSGIRGHLGGGLGGAKYEGVGWSNHSAQNAISSCCYWGVRPTAQIGVSKGNDGFWYACVLYY